MYRKKTAKWLSHLDFVILDIVSLEIAFVIAYFIRHGFTGQSALPKLYTDMVIVLVLLDLIKIIAMDTFKNVVARGFYKEFIETIKHDTAITCMVVIFLYLTKMGEYYSRMVFLLTWAFYIVISYVIRIIWKYIVSKSIISDNSNKQSLVIITTKNQADDIVGNLSFEGRGRYYILGVVITDDCMIGQQIKGIDVVSDADNVLDYLCKNWVDEVFVSLGEGNERLEKKIANDCLLMGITVHQNLVKIENEPGHVQMVERMYEYTVLSSAVNTAGIIPVMIKRMMDIAGGLIGLLVTGILFIFVAPAIYIKSPGPIFFKQTRIGKNGKKFQIYKFRSMYMDAEERKKELMAQNKVKDGMMFKMENDPRIIGGENGKGIGNFIRNTSIDEFPQFLNVLKGDMSLVGTRPPTLDEWQKYELHHRRRMATKPGITGMWQVSGRSDITDFEEVVKLDTEYILNWSIGKDIRILLKTIGVVVFGKGSM